MSQQNLEKALQLLEELEANTQAETKVKIAEAKAAVEEARKLGESEDADTLREQIQDILVKNSEFVSVMVHEVRKPMTSIRGYADMLSKNVMGELNEMQSQFVGTIRTNIISMEQLVTDVSNYSKLTTGRVTPNAKMDMFKNIAMQLEKDFADQAQDRGFDLVFEIPQGLPLLNLDSTWVQEALRKLIDNAIKYTPEGGSDVVVKAEGKENAIKITVQDRGVGISKEDQSRLGEIFFRGDQELVTSTKGYGMGIPIVMECMKLLGGSLDWHSAAGEGSTFEVVLPAMS